MQLVKQFAQFEFDLRHALLVQEFGWGGPFSRVQGLGSNSSVPVGREVWTGVRELLQVTLEGIVVVVVVLVLVLVFSRGVLAACALKNLNNSSFRHVRLMGAGV